jgi:hypothetical protein
MLDARLKFIFYGYPAIISFPLSPGPGVPVRV